MNNLMRRSGIIAVLCLVLCAMLLVTACGGEEQPAVTTSDETTGAPDVTTKPDETTKAPDVTTAEPGDDTTAEPGDDTTAEPGDDTTAEPGDDTTAAPDTDVTYTVTVKDQDGKAVVGAKVQLCEGTTCLAPVATDANGVATLTGKVGVVYQASVTEAEGYTFDATKKYDFAAGTTALTIEIEEKSDETTKPGVVVPGEATPITADVEKTTVEMTEGQVITYVYNALSNGTVSVNVTKGGEVSFVVSNITANKEGQAVTGVGKINLDTKTGNSYLINITAGADETVEYAINVEDNGNGSKANPFYLYEGMVQHTTTVPAGATVYYVFYDNYLLIDNPGVSVIFNGNVYAPSASGNITAEDLGIKFGDVIGIIGGESDIVLSIKLTGSSTECPLEVDHLGYYEIEIPAGVTAYFNATNYAIGGVLDEVVGHATVSVWGTPAEAPMLLTVRTSAFALTNRSYTYASLVEFFVMPAPDGITEDTAIELDNTADAVEVSLHDQKVSDTLFFTYTATQYGVFSTSVSGAPITVNGEYVDIVDLCYDGLVLNRGDKVLFALHFDVAMDEVVAYGMNYVTVSLEELGATEVVVPAGEAVRVAPSFQVLMNGAYLEGITGDVAATFWGRPVEAPAVFSMRGLSEVVLTNSTEEDVTAVVTVSAMPAGADMMNPIVMDGDSAVATLLVQQLTFDGMGSTVFFSYTATADGVLTTNVEASPYMLDDTYPDIVDLKTEGIAVTAGQTLIFAVPCDATADLTVTCTVTAPVEAE